MGVWALAWLAAAATSSLLQHHDLEAPLGQTLAKIYNPRVTCDLVLAQAYASW